MSVDESSLGLAEDFSVRDSDTIQTPQEEMIILRRGGTYWPVVLHLNHKQKLPNSDFVFFGFGLHPLHIVRIESSYWSLTLDSMLL